MENITGMKVAILIEDGFEQVEMVEPRKALDQAEAETSVVSPRNGHARAWNFTEWGDNFPVDVALDRARPDDFDALLLPGGVINPDKIADAAQGCRIRKGLLRCRETCGGDLPWSVDRHRDRCGSGAENRLVAVAQNRSSKRRGRVDGSGGRGGRNLVSSRKPDDIPAFNLAMIDVF